MVTVHPIHAREGEAVDIHWHRTKGGPVYIERRTCPPTDVVTERQAPPADDDRQSDR
jgi:hypothetical protein